MEIKGLSSLTAVPGQATSNRSAEGSAAQGGSSKNGTSNADFSQALNDVNSNAQVVQRGLRFSVDKNTGRTVVKVVNSATDEVIRQIPPEYLLRLAEALQQESQGVNGMLLHDRA